MEHQIIPQSPLLEEDSLSLLKQISTYNKSLNSHYDYASAHGFFIKENQEIIGGIVIKLWIGAVHIERLFVHEKIRAQGYGKKLLKEVENFSFRHNASLIAVETLSFQNALNFYLKQGYHIAFQEAGYTQGVIMYHLRKILKQNRSH